MILGYGDTMDDEGVNNSEYSSEEMTLGDFHRFRTTFESCTALATHMSPATCPTDLSRAIRVCTQMVKKWGDNMNLFFQYFIVCNTV